MVEIQKVLGRSHRAWSARILCWTGLVAGAARQAASLRQKTRFLPQPVVSNLFEQVGRNGMCQK